MIRPGQEWGQESAGAAEVEARGDDRALAAAVAGAGPGALVRFHPDPASDVARAVGLGPHPAAAREVAMDALAVRTDGGEDLAVNMVVLGAAPDRLGRFSRSFGAEVSVDGRPWFTGAATTVVVATGEFLRGHDVVPRGHPGDGRVEIQVYAVERHQRAEVRRRVATGAHVPHPQISQCVGHRVEVRLRRATRGEIDGAAMSSTAMLVAEVLPGAYRLLL